MLHNNDMNIYRKGREREGARALTTSLIMRTITYILLSKSSTFPLVVVVAVVVGLSFSSATQLGSSLSRGFSVDFRAHTLP